MVVIDRKDALTGKVHYHFYNGRGDVTALKEIDYLITKNKSDAEEMLKWYRSPIIHFPLWLLFAFVIFDFMGKLSDYGVILACGMFLCVTAVSGIISEMFYLRIPFLGKYIYDNNYILHANLILIAMGICISIISIVLGGFDVISNFVEILVKRFIS